jgi:hypothetical protein
MQRKRSSIICVDIKKGFIIFVTISALAVFLTDINAKIYKNEDVFISDGPFVLFDFDDRRPLNSLGGSAGIFDGDPRDQEACCKMDYVKDDDLHLKGFHLTLTYDVNSSRPAFNGYWIKLNGIDLSNFNAISLNIKGESGSGYSEILKIELKDNTRKIEYVLDGITDGWEKKILPFSDFEGDLSLLDLRNMDEMVIVFEDWRLQKKEGKYLIDDIEFIPKKGAKIKYSELIKIPPAK